MRLQSVGCLLLSGIDRVIKGLQTRVMHMVMPRAHGLGWNVACSSNLGVFKIRGPMLAVSVLSMTIYLGLFHGSLFLDTPT